LSFAAEKGRKSGAGIVAAPLNPRFAKCPFSCASRKPRGAIELEAGCAFFATVEKYFSFLHKAPRGLDFLPLVGATSMKRREAPREDGNVNTRLAKIALTASVGLFALLVGLDNVFDYQTNFDAVRHVLSMDTLPAGVAFGWRAVTLAALQNIAYWCIIVTELASGAFLIAGAGRMARAARYNAFIFNESKRLAITGLVVLFLLYFVGFLVVGGEWFEMWRSTGWNFQEPAFRFAAVIGVILIFVSQQDA